MKRRSQDAKCTKTLHGGREEDPEIEFRATAAFPSGKLPTKKDVILRLLHEDNYMQDAAIRKVTAELIELWQWCNVYTLSELTVRQMIKELVTQFSRFVRYPKKSKKDKFRDDLNSYLENLECLFDIFCKDEHSRSKQEHKNRLKMRDEDFQFYENQKTTRTGRCLAQVVPPTESDLRYSRRASNEDEAHERERLRQEELVNVASTSFAAEASSEATTGTESSEEQISEEEDRAQNRTALANLARACDRYNISDRAGAAVASAALKDFGLLSSDDKTNVIDRHKLRRERDRHRQAIRQDEERLFAQVESIYVDGCKDATMVMTQAEGKSYRQTILEEHYVVVGEPGEFYLTHVTPDDGKGATIGKALYDVIENTDLQEKITTVGSDGTAVMTGPHTGCIRSLEEMLEEPLQWSICLLHCNELPLRHIFTELDGATNSPDSFSGKIGSKLNDIVSNWPVVKFKPIKCEDFPDLPDEVVDGLSSDQQYSYRICRAVISGEVDPDLQLLEIGPLCHARWLTLACRILRYYVSQRKASKTLSLLADFCIKVYFCSWFQIKQNSKITDGTKNFFMMMQRCASFPNKRVSSIAVKVLQKNAYFAHPENVLLCMLADLDPEVRNKAVETIQQIRDREEEDNSGSEEGGSIRKFEVPEINVKATSYIEIVDLDTLQIIPPALRNIKYDEIQNLKVSPVDLKQPCHNQAVERHIKLVTDAASTVVGYERRDGMIRQRIASRKLMKTFKTKKQFK